MHKAIVGSIVALFIASAAAEVVERPVIKPHDSWTYTSTVEKNAGWRQTHEEITVVRANETEILVAIQEAGSKMPPKEQLTGPDWSRFRSVNGHEEVVNRPFMFPLSPGKAWEVEYTEDHPNREFLKRQFHSNYKVVGWEQVKVPAGTFLALKIEAQGQWTAELAPSVSASASTHVDNAGSISVTRANKSVAQTATGRMYKAFWYVPETKRYVKTVEEYFGSNGVRNERYSYELDSFKVQ